MFFFIKMKLYDIPFKMDYNSQSYLPKTVQSRRKIEFQCLFAVAAWIPEVCHPLMPSELLLVQGNLQQIEYKFETSPILFHKIQ